MTDSTRITINVIGAGQWGPNLIRNFTNLPQSRVGMVCDVDEKKLENLSLRFPDVTMTTDTQAAISDTSADAVAIITPMSTHYQLAKQGLLAGKDVLVEKPLAQSVQECEELALLAEEKKLILMVGHVFKFNPGIRYVQQLIEEGALGRIISLHAIRTNLGPVRSDANALWDLGAHDLSIFNYWLDAYPLSVTASGLAHLSEEREDTVVANYEYPNDIMATIYTSWLHPRKVREITVVGEFKMVVWDDMDLNEPVRIYDKGVDREDSYADTFGGFRLTLREGLVIIPPVGGKEPLTAECEHFLECVLKRKTPLADAQDGLEVVRALAAANQSMRSNSKSISF
jgi:predicted dehydrogenase